MADNDFKIKVILDKATLEQLKADNRKMLMQVQADSKKSIEQLKADNKLMQTEASNLSKERIARIKAETAAKNLEWKKQVQTEKQAIKEAEAERKRADRQAIEDAKLLSRVRAREMQAAFPKEKKGMSLFQGLEFGENLTIVSAGITAAIYAITKATKQLFDIAKQGAEYGVLKANFEQMSGGAENAKKNIELLYKAAAGNIDKSELMGISNEYKFLGINIEQVARLLDGIETRGDAVHIQFREALDAVNKYIMSGMQRGLLQGLKFNVADVKKEFDSLVLASGKSKDALTDEELQSIRLKVALNILGTEAKTTGEILNKSFDNADKLAAIETRYKNIKDELSLIASGNVVSYIDRLNEKLNDSSLALEGNETAISKTADAFGTFVGIVETFAPASVMGNLSLQFNKAFVSITQWIDTGTGSFNTFISALNVNPNTSWVSPILNGLRDIYDAARDAYNAIFTVTNTSVNTGVTDLDTRVNNALKTNEAKYNKHTGLYVYDTAPNPMPLQTRGSSRGSSRGNTTDAIKEQVRETGKLAENYVKLVNLADNYAAIIRSVAIPVSEGTSGLSRSGPADQFSGAQSPVGRTMEGIINSISEPFKEVSSSISNVFSDLMNTLGLETNSFVGRLVSGFDTVLSIVNMIVNTLNAVNAVKGLIGTIASIIPGGGLIAGAAGGMAGGMPLPMMQSGNSRPIVNVVVQSEVESTKAIKFFDNNFNAYQNYLRANSY